MCSRVKGRLGFRGLLKSFDLDIFMRDDCVVVRFSWTVPDACDPNGELVTVHSDTTLDAHAFAYGPAPEDYLIRSVRMAIKEALWHELDEGFWLDGTYYRHPHPEEIDGA
jgi:hypothetical protein